MKLLSYDFDRDKLKLNFDTSFSKIKLQKLENEAYIDVSCNGSIRADCLKLESDVIQFSFSKPKNTVSLCTTLETKVVILVIIEVDGLDKNEAMMMTRRSSTDDTDQPGSLNGIAMLLNGLSKTTITKPFEKNETSGIHATIRRKASNGNR